MLQPTPIRVTPSVDYLSEAAARRERLAKVAKINEAAAQSDQFYDGVNARIQPLRGWPDPRQPQIPASPEQRASPDGVGGPEDGMSPREAAMAELARRRAAAGASEGGQAVQALSPKEAAKAELARRQAAAPKPLFDNAAPQYGAFGNQKSLLEDISGRPDQVELDPDVLARTPIQYEPMKESSQLQAFAGNYANTGTFGLAPKIAALPYLMPGGHTYDEAEQAFRDRLQTARAEHPVSSLAGDVGGFATPGGIIAKGVGTLTKGAVNMAQRAGPTLGFLAKTAQAAGMGGAAGGAYGATVGAENAATDEGLPSPALAERVNDAGEAAKWGAAFGGAMPAAGVVLRPVARAAEGAVAKVGEALKLTPGSVERFNTKVGADAARRALERSGIVTLDDFLRRAATYGDKPVVTGELGQDALNSLVALVRTKGTTADKAMAVLEERVSGLPGRMLKDIADETGMNPDEVLGAVEDMVKAGRARAAPLYEASEATPFAETASLTRLVADSPILRSLMPIARNRVQNQAAGQFADIAPLRQGNLAPGETPIPPQAEAITHEALSPIKVYDELKQLLDEEITRRLAKGEGIGDVEGVRKALLSELDEISAEGADYLTFASGQGTKLTAPKASPYAVAREAGGDAPKIIAGLKGGERALSGAKLASDVEREVSALVGGELTAYQSGVIRNLVKEVENGRLTPRRIKTQAFQKKLESTFGKPAADGLVQKFGVESELITKGSRWNPNVGSVTSQAQLGQPSRAADEMVQAARSAITGRPVDAVMQLGNMLRRQGYSENQRNALGDMLLRSPDDAAKLLYPDQTPTPGMIPPPTPPAGRVRENAAPVHLPRQGLADAVQGVAGPIARDTAGGLAGAITGAVTTPEGQDRTQGALAGAGLGAIMAHTMGAYANRAPGFDPAIAGARSNGISLPWVKSMLDNGFTPQDVEQTQRLLIGRFSGKSVDAMAKGAGVPPESLNSRIADLQGRLNAAGIDVDINAGRVGASMKPTGKAPVVPRDQLPPKDLVTAYNDGDSALSIGLDLELPENANIANRIAMEQTRLRNVAREAQAAGRTPELAQQWGVTPDEIDKFVSMRPKAGKLEENITRIVEAAEKAAKSGNPIQPKALAERFGMSPGSLNATLSQIRSGARAVSEDLRQRVQGLQFARGRPVSESAPEISGGLAGAVSGGVMAPDIDGDGVVSERERALSALVGAGVGAAGGNLARRVGVDKTKTGAFGGSLSKLVKPDANLDDYIPDATPEIVRQVQQAYIARGETPPMFKMFRKPDGQVIAWRGDSDPRGGLSHDQAREALGLGNIRLEHNEPFGLTDKAFRWRSDASGEGPEPRSLEALVRKGTKEGQPPGEVLLDATPEEVMRDLRAIGAEGPGSTMKDYPYRRKLAMDTKPLGENGRTWVTPSGKNADLYFGGGSEPTAGFSLDGMTTPLRIPGVFGGAKSQTQPSTAEVKETFEKAFAVMERETIKRGKDAYIFSGAGDSHNRLYRGALERLGAPQGYVAIISPDSANFGLLRVRHFDDLVAQGKVRPEQWTIIRSKRGDAEVPEWRRRTGQFAIPAAGGIGLAELIAQENSPGR